MNAITQNVLELKELKSLKATQDSYEMEQIKDLEILFEDYEINKDYALPIFWISSFNTESAINSSDYRYEYKEHYTYVFGEKYLLLYNDESTADNGVIKILEDKVYHPESETPLVKRIGGLTYVPTTPVVHSWKNT